MPDVEIVVSDGEESFALIAHHEEGGWLPHLDYVVGDGRVRARPVCVHRVAEAGPYPTPGKCILALAEAVVSELCGVRV